jgi:hypothetical protein
VKTCECPKAVIAFREDRVQQIWELALSCGCNVSMPMKQRTLIEMIRAICDVQKEHTCGR